MRNLNVTVGKSRFDKGLARHEWSWQDFLQRFEEPIRTKETVEQFKRSSIKQQTAAKDKGCYVVGTFRGANRRKENLVGRDAICLDMDHAGADWSERLESAMKKWAYMAHTTRKHSEKTPRVRVVVPTSRTLLPEEYQPVARMVAAQIGIDQFDDTTYAPARVMYWPTASKDADNYERIVGASETFLDVDRLLTSMYKDWKDTTEWPVSSRENSAPRAPSGKKLKDPTERSGVVGAFCRVYDIHSAIAEFIPDRYEATGDRYTYAEGSTAAGLVVYDDKFAFSHHENDPCSGRSVNAFDLVRIHKYGEADAEAQDDTPPNKLPSYAKMAEFCKTLDSVQEEMVKASADDGFDPADGFEVLDSAPPSGQHPVVPQRPERDPKWKNKLDKHSDNGRIYVTLPNLALILENDEALSQIDLRHDEMRERVTMLGHLPWDPERSRHRTEYRDEDDLDLKVWLETRWKMNGEVSNQKLADAVMHVAWKNRFHPVREWLRSLTWDGTERLDTMLVDHLGCMDSNYVRAVARKWLCGAVARVFDPGCRFQYMLVLESPEQGIGKSTFGRILAGDDWFNDDIAAVDGKDAIEALQGAWIVEMAELHTLSKAEVEKTKAFISRQTDKMRPAYGRRVRLFPRQTVFIGTTNEEVYLKDATGNRRFWPVLCHVRRMDEGRLNAEREQLFAEAVARYDSGEPLYLEDRDTEKEALIQQALRFTDSGLVGIIEEKLGEPVRVDHYKVDPDIDMDEDPNGPTEPRDRVCIMEIWTDFLGGSTSNLSPQKTADIRNAMKRIPGWRATPNPVSFGRFGKQRGWRRVGADAD